MRTSASQHNAFQRCQRYWYFGWIDKIKWPTSEAMQRGTDIHKEVEHFLLTGKFRDSSYTDKQLNYRPYVEALKPHLPPPKHPELLLERRIDIKCGPGMPGWLGYIDIAFDGGVPLEIKDIKSTSDFRWAKTPVELEDDIQLNSYGKWVYTATDYDGPIDLGLIYVKTAKGKVPKKPKTKPICITLERVQIEDVWDREMDTVREMQTAALVGSAHDLEPTVSACGMFGGCPYRTECNLDAKTLLSQLFTQKDKEKPMGKSFMEKLRGKKKGILPPDAPSRTVDADDGDEEPEETAAEKKKRVKKEKAAAKKKEKVEADAEAGEKLPVKKKNGVKKSFVLYVDCMPAKDVDNTGLEPTLFEDWFGDITMKMNAIAEEEADVGSFWLLSFGKQKALIEHVIGDSIKSLPPEMVMDSNTTGAKDALAHLSPHATKVIRGIR